MSTKIQWTDETWNPTTGCTKISPGCANCYIERTPAFRIAGRKFVKGVTDLRLHEDRLMRPLRWQAPRRVFVNSLSDLFHESVPDRFIVDVFGVMLLAHWHTFQVLTKRPRRMLEFLSRGDHGIVAQMHAMMTGGGISTKPVFRALDVKRRDGVPLTWPPPNVWLGVSVENQHFADERIPLLLQTPAAVRFISAEPLLGPIDFTLRGDHVADWDEDWRYDVLSGEEWAGPRDDDPERSQHLDWVIVGVEQLVGHKPGRNAEAYEAQTRVVLQQCAGAGVAAFHKQMPIRGRVSGDPAEWPADLRVREYPA